VNQNEEILEYLEGVEVGDAYFADNISLLLLLLLLLPLLLLDDLLLFLDFFSMRPCSTISTSGILLRAFLFFFGGSG